MVNSGGEGRMLWTIYIIHHIVFLTCYRCVIGTLSLSRVRLNHSKLRPDKVLNRIPNVYMRHLCIKLMSELRWPVAGSRKSRMRGEFGSGNQSSDQSIYYLKVP